MHIEPGLVSEAKMALSHATAVAAGGKSGLMPECPVCHLVGAVVPPDAAQGPMASQLRFVAEVVLPQAQRAAATPPDPAHRTRAPPLV